MCLIHCKSPCTVSVPPFTLFAAVMRLTPGVAAMVCSVVGALTAGRCPGRRGVWTTQSCLCGLDTGCGPSLAGKQGVK